MIYWKNKTNIDYPSMYFKQMEDFVNKKMMLKKYWIQAVKDMKLSFQSCLETISSGIGIARGA